MIQNVDKYNEWKQRHTANFLRQNGNFYHLKEQRRKSLFNRNGIKEKYCNIGSGVHNKRAGIFCQHEEINHFYEMYNDIKLDR